MLFSIPDASVYMIMVIGFAHFCIVSSVSGFSDLLIMALILRIRHRALCELSVVWSVGRRIVGRHVIVIDGYTA